MADEMTLEKVPTQGVHHITLVGADRQTSIDFWEGLLAMPFIFHLMDRNHRLPAGPLQRICR